MTLDRELPERTKHLASREPRRPKQASLRRAVSSAYYALFHLLIREATVLLAPPSPPHLWPLVARAFQHNEMRAVARTFESGGSLGSHHPRIQPSPELREVAGALRKLQEARHAADYDLQVKFTRATVALLLLEAERAFTTWSKIRRDEDAKVFLTALLLEKRWRR